MTKIPDKEELSFKPYLLRAIIHWTEDQDLSPIIQINPNIVSFMGIQLKYPKEYEDETGNYLINISKINTHNRVISNSALTCEIIGTTNTQSIKAMAIVVPIINIIAIGSVESDEMFKLEE